ncbi:methyltransferase [Paenibacillus sp. 1001270B_150601_E10]|uniref:methyltransferase n=1 Tax=Paenibacillus sp. 1001270B_150601_E10 TaxID=2787079 RepID=UPI00189E9DB6|nr:methyltransferase [Paenibacillus sp. 1001270B_150601_E10]
MPHPSNPDHHHRAIAARMERILDPQHTLCRDDILWVLNMVKNQLASNQASVIQLGAERLARNYRYYAEVAVIMLHRSRLQDSESDRLRLYLQEAAHGLWQPIVSSNDT